MSARTLRLILSLLIACGLACTAWASETKALSPSLNRADLMKAAYGDWAPDKPCCWTLVVPDGIQWSPWLPGPGKPSAMVETDPLSIYPLHVIRLDDKNAALVTVSVPEDCGHSCSHFISVVFFAAEESGWREGDHVDAAAWVAFYPSNNWVQQWTGHGFVVSFTSGSCWQGYCTDDIVLLGLQEDRVLPLLATSLRASSESAGEGGTATGAWRFEGDQVIFSFHGNLREAGDTGRGLLKPWTRHVVLALRGNHLVPVSGALPKFGF